MTEPLCPHGFPLWDGDALNCYHDLPDLEEVSGYEDAPRWYWWLVAESGGGWRGDVLLFALFGLLGAIVALVFAIVAISAR